MGIVERIRYYYDEQGNTTALTDDDGNVTDAYVFTAFGETVASTGTTVNPYKYGGEVGYQTDPNTGDIYVRARI